MSSHALRQLFHARLTVGLVVVWLALEAWRSMSMGSSNGYYLNLGFSRDGMAKLQLWQPVTYALIHGGWVHVLMNALLMLAVGTRLEWILGRRPLAVVLVAGTLLGGMFHLALSPHILVGGSGAVFSVLLCVTTLSSESRWLMPFPLSAKNLGRGLLIASLILTLINPAYRIPGLSRLGELVGQNGMRALFGISHACHLGGAIAGWLCARWILRSRVSLESLRRDRARREL